MSARPESQARAPRAVKVRDDAEAARPVDRNDPQRLDNQLCFAVYAAAHAFGRAYRALLNEHDLTYPQYLVLLVLWETDGVTVSEIGRRLRLDSGTLTPVLKRLETAGLVARSRRRTDEREVEVSLTPSGRELRSQAVSVRQSVMCQLNMTEPEIQAMRADLNALIENLSTGA
jgi:MarR family transcriptional regulator, organic hydroperoxide resistance regulator